jgi:hypothetical protein
MDEIHIPDSACQQGNRQSEQQEGGEPSANLASPAAKALLSRLLPSLSSINQ